MRYVLLLYFLLFFLCTCSNDSQFQGLDSEFSFPNTSSNDRGEWQTEEFILDIKESLLDILIVADSSQSMYHRLNSLGHSLSDLLSVISNYDWQIGFTSVDHGDHDNPLGIQDRWRDHVLESHGRFGSLMNLEDNIGVLRAKILTKRMSDYRDIFFRTLSHGQIRDCNRPPYCHQRLEQPLRSLKSAMERAVLDNSLLFRAGADFVSLIITNESERTEDKDRATTAWQVVDTFYKVFGHLDKKFIAYNIIIMDEKCLIKEKKEAKKMVEENAEVISIAHSIAKLAVHTGGQNISLCSESYGQALRGISQHIKDSLENSIVLKNTPIPETVNIDFINGPELNWNRYGRNIVFEERGSRSIHVSVSYKSEGKN